MNAGFLSSLHISVYLLLMLGCLPAAVSIAAPQQEPTQQVLRVVGDNNYPPFLFIDPDGRAVGYVADWWALWEKKTGVKVELNATNWAEAQRIISHGQADVIDNIFRTPPREPLYDFTAPYADVPVNIYRHDSITGIQDIKGLRSFQIGVMAGDACIDMLRQNGITTLREYKDYTALIKGALAEDVKIFCLDEYPANYYLYHENAQKTFHKAFQIYEGRFHRAVQKGNSKTLQLVEHGANAISPAEIKALRKKWIPEAEFNYGPFVRYIVLAAGVLIFLTLLLSLWLLSMRTAVRKKTAELRGLNRKLRAISACNQYLVKATDENTLLRDICTVVCEKAGYSLAWVGYAEQDESKTVRPVAWAGAEAGYLSSIRICWDETPAGKGPTGTAVRESKTVYTQDFETDGRMAPWRDDALIRGYRSSIALPLRNNIETAFGALTVYSSGINAFTPDEINLLEELADNLAFGICALRAHQEQNQAEEMLRKKNADLEQFLYTVSHDLRSPLVTIKTFLGYLKQDMINNNEAHLSQDFQFIHDAADKMKLLLDELLDLSRVDRVEASPVSVSFLELVSEVLNTLAGSINAQHVRIKVADRDVVLTGDRLRLFQIFQNLIENAIKYCTSGSTPSIEIGLDSGDEDTIFFISDNGIGIDPAYHSKIFSIFEKLDPKSPGIGLGLTMVHRIVNKYGGRIWVESEGVGMGTCFRFTLPNAVM